MTSIDIYPDQHELAEQAARKAALTIRSCIARQGNCTWVLAGGSTPVAAYRVIADRYLDTIDWSSVTILIGDERIAPLDSDDSNWHQAEQALLRHIPEASLLRPRSDLPLGHAVDHYHQVVDNLPKGLSGAPRFDLVWLGVGEDGHTLSLFPGSSELGNTTDLILPVDDSPKPPSQRLTFGLSTLGATSHLQILAAGNTKASAITAALAGEDLPIAKAASIVEQSGGHVEWLIDQAAHQ